VRGSAWYGTRAPLADFYDDDQGRASYYAEPSRSERGDRRPAVHILRQHGPPPGAGRRDRSNALEATEATSPHVRRRCRDRAILQPDNAVVARNAALGAAAESILRISGWPGACISTRDNSPPRRWDATMLYSAARDCAEGKW